MNLLKRKKNIVLVIMGLIVFLVVNFIYTAFKVSDNNYTRIVNDQNISDIFNSHYKERISFKSALGNDVEQVFFYKYFDDIDLIVYKIKGYKNVRLRNTHMYLIDSFEDIQINPQRYHDFGYFDLTSKLDTFKARDLVLYSDYNAKILKHFENDTAAYISIYSHGILIAENENDPHIKINSNNSRVFNLYIKKKNDAMYLFFLTHRDDIENNILLKIIN